MAKVISLIEYKAEKVIKTACENLVQNINISVDLSAPIRFIKLKGIIKRDGVTYLTNPGMSDFAKELE